MNTTIASNKLYPTLNYETPFFPHFHMMVTLETMSTHF